MRKNSPCEYPQSCCLAALLTASRPLPTRWTPRWARLRDQSDLGRRARAAASVGIGLRRLCHRGVDAVGDGRAGAGQQRQAKAANRMGNSC